MSIWTISVNFEQFQIYLDKFSENISYHCSKSETWEIFEERIIGAFLRGDGTFYDNYVALAEK